MLPRKRLFLSMILSLSMVLAATAAAQSYPGAPQPMRAFGAAVAVAEGDVLVGEPQNPGAPGVVHVYRRGTGGAWTEAAQITAPDAAPGDGFGGALDAAGDRLVVTMSGGAHVFRRQGGAWRHEARLAVPPDEDGEPFVPASVAISGSTAVVGVAAKSEGRGTAHVYRASGAAWSHAGELAVDGLKPRSGFGTAVATDGERVLVGAPGLGELSGAVYAFRRSASGAWERVGTIDAPAPGGREAFGLSLDLRGDLLAVGAPGAAQAAGAVYLMRPQGDTWAAATRLTAPEGKAQELFGSAVALASDALWVGAMGTPGQRGDVLAFPMGPQGVRADAGRRLAPAEARASDRVGASVAADGRVAAVGISGADFGLGRVAVYEPAAGEWRMAATVFTTANELAAVTGAAVPCAANGRAAHFECSNVELLSFLPVTKMGGPRGTRTNDIWGWTDPETGKEYALVGMLDRTVFVDVTDGANPVYVGYMPKTEAAQAAVWREIWTYANHAFVVADGAGPHGLQIVDLTRLRQFRGEPLVLRADTTYTRVNSVHNIHVNEETGIAYAMGSSSGGETCGGGLHMVDVRQPKSPTFAGCFADPQTGQAGTGYTHDAQCVVYRGPDARYRGKEICFGSNETALSIADVTDKAAPVAISRATYPNAAYAHQGWLTADQRYFYMDDELDEMQRGVERTRTLIWDVSDLQDPQLVGEFMGTTGATDHNMYMVGNLIFQSNYQAGLRILDASNPTQLREVGYLDTVPTGDNGPGFGGTWGNYPFFKDGKVVVASAYEGLFVVKARIP